jgi:cellulose synthase/poly-beta-1,6-N-acetylglucosamine synthase-like glycosyltransferase
LHGLLSGVLTFFDLVLAAYFLAGNGTYTLLMLLSLVSVWLHNRHHGDEALQQLWESPVTPPVTIIMPAWNEEDVIVDAVRSTLHTHYPSVQVCVVDDGSSDRTLERLIAAFKLAPTGLIQRLRLSTRPIRALYSSPECPNLLVVSKENGGKPDALNAGLNVCRTPYFCMLDSDCVLERDALVRLMRPVIHSPVNIVVSGGIVRIQNGCTVADGQVTRVGLPKTGLERFQVVEYLRSFLFGRTGWDLLGCTLVVSGAFAVFHLETVIEAGGFGTDTVTEDLELVVRLRRWAVEHHRTVRTSFTSDPVCWSQCPSNLPMLARQRRRWQLGLCQTLWKNLKMFFNPAFGAVGLFTLPFHAFVEGLGALVETIGYFFIAAAACLKPQLLRFLLPFVLLSLAYAGFLSFGAVVLEELTHRRYPSARQLAILLAYALLENFGYRQLVLWYRFEGVLRFFLGFRRWEKVVHVAARERATT